MTDDAKPNPPVQANGKEMIKNKLKVRPKNDRSESKIPDHNVAKPSLQRPRQE